MHARAITRCRAINLSSLSHDNHAGILSPNATVYWDSSHRLHICYANVKVILEEKLRMGRLILLLAALMAFVTAQAQVTSYNFSSSNYINHLQ